MQLGDGFLRAIFERIGHGDHTAHCAIHRHQHGGLGFGLKSLDFGFQTIQRVVARIHHAQVAHRHLVAIDLGLDALPGFAWKPLDSDSARLRVVASAQIASPSGCSQPFSTEAARRKQLVSATAMSIRDDIGHSRLPLRDRAGFIQHHHRDLPGALQRFADCGTGCPARHLCRCPP